MSDHSPIPPSPLVLVVDDSPTTAAMLRMILERSGYTVRLAHSGREALAAVDAEKPDLVLCDIEMPDMDGLQVLEVMRADPATERIPVIMVTSKAEVADKIRGLDTGATDYVTKPFKMEELKARIRTHLRMKAMADELLERNAQLARTQVMLEEKIEALRGAYQKIAEHQSRTQKAMDLASKVQRGLLPAVPTELGGHRVEATFRPAEEVAGDFYDFVDLGNGRYGIAIGDVAGKGIAAALVMVLIRTIFRAVVHTEEDPARVLETINRTVIAEYGSQDATTLFFGVLDTKTGAFSFSNGGHEFPVLTSADGSRAVELCVGGPFLGIFPRARYNRGCVWLSPGDRLTLFTDGLYHLSTATGKLENGDRVMELLRLRSTASLDTMLGELGRAQGNSDDITMIRIECGPLKDTSAHALGSLAIHNSPTNLREVRAFVGAVARAAGLSGRRNEEFAESVGEIVANAVHHAYESENSGQVEIRVDQPGGAHDLRRLCAEVVDHGRGFDPGAIHPPDPELPDVRGNGLSVARAMSDAFEIRSKLGAGTTVLLTKNL